MLRIVLDTNVLVASISRRSPHHWVWQSFIQGKYQLCITTDILDEYAEIIERFFSAADAEYTLTQITLQKNVIPIIRYYDWNVSSKTPTIISFLIVPLRLMPIILFRKINTLPF
jgi:predicted nucleic acid-binding protein